MSGRCFTGHAQQRAFERYGLTLGDADFAAILTAIQSGNAPCLRLVEKLGSIHAVRFNGAVLIVAVAFDKPLIVTMMPPDYFCRGTNLKRSKTKNLSKQKNRKTASAENPEYRRAQWKNDIQFDEEEG